MKDLVYLSSTAIRTHIRPKREHLTVRTHFHFFLFFTSIPMSGGVTARQDSNKGNGSLTIQLIMYLLVNSMKETI